MRMILPNKNSMIAVFFASVFCGTVMMQTNEIRAADFTAGSVLKRMSSSELNAYVTGLVDGFAYARYKQEGQRTDGGMKCIYDWFFNGGQTIKQIAQAFRKFNKHEPNAVVAAMIAQKCGK